MDPYQMIVVTGAAGFIGSNLISRLNADGITNIIAVDDLTNGDKAANLGGLKFLDYLDWEVFCSSGIKIGNLSRIIHLGANTNTRDFNGKRMMENNYDASKTMLSIAAEHKVPLIYASSASVYGSDPNNTFVEDPANERPGTPYAVSKWVFDQFVRRYHVARQEHSVTGLRFFNVYGPNEAHKQSMRSYPSYVFDALVNNDPFELYEGSHHFRRDFVFVDDVISVICHFLRSPTSGIFNVGSGEARTFSNVISLAQTSLGLRDDQVMIDYMPFPRDYKHYQMYTIADLTKLRAAGYTEPMTILETGMAQLFEREFSKYRPSARTQDDITSRPPEQGCTGAAVRGETISS